MIETGAYQLAWSVNQIILRTCCQKALIDRDVAHSEYESQSS
jgi:hypothetical protein